jgi:antibiotic biosynthesis monooxygenase (ABM) superfamily enzyme
MPDEKQNKTNFSAGLDPDGQPRKKLPAWAIWLAVLAFVIFNCFFALFAMQMGSGENN